MIGGETVIHTTSIIQNFSIVASAMGFMLTFVVFANRKYLSNFYLSFVFLFLSISLLFPDTPNMISEYPLLLFTGMFNYLYGPCMLRYVHHTLYSDFPPRVSFYVHSIPAMGYALFCLYAIFTFSGGEVQAYINQTLSGHPPILVVFFNYLSAISLIFYTAAMIRLIVIHRAKLGEAFHHSKQKGWFIAMIFVFVSLVGGGLLYTFAETYYQEILNEIYMVQLFSAAMCMVVFTLFAVQNPTILTWEQVRDKLRKKLNLGESQVKEIKEKIKTIMENEQLFLDESLNLQFAAERVDVHPNVLSFVINDNYGKGFKQFINDYRCDYFIQLLNDKPETPILHLAYEAGFPSKTTFHEVFNKKYNMTPTQFRQKKNSI